MNVLFVCGGNTCRSPMTAAFCQHNLGADGRIDSSGIAPHGDRPTADAIAVVRDRIGVDISRHQPHGIRRDEIRQYDYIIAMDLKVGESLRGDYGVPDSQMLVWQIADPYLRGRLAYERCADEIDEQISRLAQMAKRASRGDGASSGVSARLRSGSSLAASCAELVENVGRWQAELTTGQIRGTLLHGIAKKAVDSFEELFRVCVDSHRALAPGHESASSKPFHRLTFGELIEFTAQHNAPITAACRRTPRRNTLFNNRRVLRPGFRGTLDKISVLRNSLHHRPSEFAPDLNALHENSHKTLALLSTALEDSFFEYVCVEVKREA
jgi:protein-tyrosine phosphatase